MPGHTYWIDNDTGKKHRLNGLQPSTRQPIKENLRRDFTDEIKYKNEEDLPKGGVDLRPGMPPVQCQAAIASCTANALAAAYAYLLRQEHSSQEDVSRLFIYYNARLKKKMEKMKDSGVSMTFAIEALEEAGVCHDGLWPYDVKKVNDPPNDDAYKAAKNLTITEALVVDPTLMEMKSILAQGFPFAFGLTLYESFDQAKTKGVVPMPTLHEATHKKHPAHAMLAVGYNEKQKVFIARNSWSESWGDGGYCYIPYDYMTDKVRCYDLWSIRRLKSNDLGRDHWKENPEWSPCSFTYSEEYHRVETYHYDQNVFQQITEDDDDDDENDEDFREPFSYEQNLSFDQEEPSYSEYPVNHSWQQPNGTESESYAGDQSDWNNQSEDFPGQEQTDEGEQYDNSWPQRNNDYYE